MSSDDLSEKKRKHFLGWQCRLRQFSIRNLNAEPSTGMQPDIVLAGTDTGFEAVTVLLVHEDSAEITAEFRHMIRKTKDPKLRYDSALKFLAERHYQYPKEFSEFPTATFNPGSKAADRMLEHGKVILSFEEKGQKYKIPCDVKQLTPDDPAWQATYWHNHLFNSSMPGDMPILQFIPDWEACEAEPPVY